MIDRYLDRGDMFVLDDDGVKAECVVTEEAHGVYEIKNIAVLPEYQRRGFGRRLVDFVLDRYPDCEELLVGTGECPSTLDFYHRCGFTESGRIENFFTDNYDPPIYEDGIRLVDMVYLKRTRRNGSCSGRMLPETRHDRITLREFESADIRIFKEWLFEEHVAREIDFLRLFM